MATQEFFINRGSVLPTLRMELINDGRFDFHNYNDAIEDADVTFSMWDDTTGVLQISNATANVVESDDTGCEDRHIIEYIWQTRDTKRPGLYKGQFTITFKGDLTSSGSTYPSGVLKMPIKEDLMIYIK